MFLNCLSLLERSSEYSHTSYFIAGIPQLAGFAFFVIGIPFKIFSRCYFYCWNFILDSLRLHSVAGISRAMQVFVPKISFKILSEIPTSPIFVSSGLIKHLRKCQVVMRSVVI